jgi:hypothetical protein
MLAGSGAVTALTTILSPVVPGISRASLRRRSQCSHRGDDGVEPEGARGTTRLDGIKNILLHTTQKSSEGEIHISIVGRQIDRGEVEQAAWVELSLRP